MSFKDPDPTGFLSAAEAAISLASTSEYKIRELGTQSQEVGSSDPRPRNAGSTTILASETAVDDIDHSDIMSWFVYVLRSLGEGLCAADLVHQATLARVIATARDTLDVSLLSKDAVRFFKILAAEAKTPSRITSIFVSIYFLGAIVTELSQSLPNYKETYLPLAPCIIQHYIIAAVGEEAFRYMLRENLHAIQTIVSISGLLNPTPFGQTIFPGTLELYNVSNDH